MANIELSRKFPLRKGYWSRSENEEREAQHALIWGRAPQGRYGTQPMRRTDDIDLLALLKAQKEARVAV